MNKAIPLVTKTDAEYEAEVDHYLKAAQQLQQRMAEDREEIKALQEETRAILDNLMATFKAA